MRAWILLAALLFAGCALLLNAEESGEPKAPAAEQLQRWVNDLGAEDFFARAHAEQSLRNAGPSALPFLEKALPSKDPEVQLRAGRTLAFIKTRPLLKRLSSVLADSSIEAEIVCTPAKGVGPAFKGQLRSAPGAKRYVLDFKAAEGASEYQTHVLADGATVYSETTLPQGAKQIDSVLQWLLERAGPMHSRNLVRNASELLARTEVKEFSETRRKEEDFYLMEGPLAKESAHPLDPLREEAAAARFTVAKADSFPRRIEILNARGEALLTLEFSNVVVGAQFDENIFKYTPPKDARVNDLSGDFRRMLRANENAAKRE